MTGETTATPFSRDRFTWVAYGLLALYAYLQAVLGPLMPFLRTDLRLSYTLGGLHASAFAAGMTLAGLTAGRLVQSLRRRSLFWGGGLSMAISALLLAASPHAALSLPSVLLMGYGGTLLLIMIAAMLADRHGPQRSVAILESQVAAIVSATLAPVAVGLLTTWGRGWKIALLLPAALFGLAWGLYRRVPLPERSRAMPDGPLGPRPHQLPGIFWAYWIVLVLSVAAEWSIVYWSADFLVTAAGLDNSQAALTMTLFFAAAVIGRITGSRLVRTFRSQRLLLLAVVVALLGFPLVWLAPVTAVRVAGLILLGLGVSNLYPLLLAIATSLAPTATDAASARVSLGAGLAILLAPFLLGLLADRVGLPTAFSLIGWLLGAATALIGVMNHLSNRAWKGQMGS